MNYTKPTDKSYRKLKKFETIFANFSGTFKIEMLLATPSMNMQMYPQNSTKCYFLNDLECPMEFVRLLKTEIQYASSIDIDIHYNFHPLLYYIITLIALTYQHHVIIQELYNYR